MKVLIVHNRYRIGGGEDVVVDQETRLLREYGHDVATWLTASREFLALSRLRQGMALFWNQRMFARMRTQIAADRPDVIHVHNTYPLISPAVLYAARAEKVPLVMTVHNYRLACLNAYLFRNGRVCRACLGRIPWRGVLYGCYRSRVEALALCAMLVVHRCLRTWDMVDAFIALSEFSRDIMIRAGLPGDRIHIKPNFLIDPQVHSGARDREMRALYVGRLSPEKGLQTLLQAWKEIGFSVPLDIVGDPQLPDGSLFREPGLPGVHFLGPQRREDVLALMRRASMLIVPSLWYEGQPMVCLEAFATGTPVLVSRLGALPGLVEGNGLTFEAGNAADLVRQVRRLRETPGLIQELGRQGREKFLTTYAPAGNHDMLLGIYERAVRRIKKKAAESGL